MYDIAIKTDRLTKRFKDVVAVDHISFDVRKGEIFGFLGPNGAGKTTTIRMLCTLTRPTDGTATVAGFDIIRDQHRVREHIGLVSEKMIMYDRLTARENLKLFGKLYNIPGDELNDRISDLMSLVKMEKWANTQIGTFSTGMKQRINVIRALLNQPEILYLDEPTLGLDPQSSSEIRDFIRCINEENGTSIILTTHMMVEADLLCDRIGIIDDGKIVAMDTPDNLKRIVSGGNTTVMELKISNLTTHVTDGIRSLDCVNSLTFIDDTHVKIQSGGENAFDKIIDTVRRMNGNIVFVKTIEPTLEDVFLHLTGHEVRDHASDKVRSSGHGPHGRVQKRVR